MNERNDSLFSDLTKLIPGYGSYLKQESWRDDDRLTREFLRKRLSDCKTRLEAVGKNAVADGDFETPARIDKLVSQLSHAQNRLAASVEGYAGWFGQRRVDAEVLEQVAKMDANLVSVVDQIDALARQIEAQSTQQFSELNGMLEMLHTRIDRRSEVLKAGA